MTSPGKRAEQAREALGLKPGQLAKRIGDRLGKKVHWQSIRQFERGVTVNPGFFAELCAELGKDPQYIRSGVGEEGGVREGAGGYKTQPAREVLALLDSGALSDADAAMLLEIAKRLSQPGPSK